MSGFLDGYFNQSYAAYLDNRARQQQLADAEGVPVGEIVAREFRQRAVTEDATTRNRLAAETVALRAQQQRLATAEAAQQQTREQAAAREAARIAASQAHWTAVANGTWSPRADGVFPPTTYGQGS